MTPLPEKLKRTAEDAFHNNSLLALMSLEEREQAAAWYEAYANYELMRILSAVRLPN
jgi:hypothetical protein